MEGEWSFYRGAHFNGHMYILLYSMVNCGFCFLYIVLCKMFSRWFFANKKLIMTIRTLKFGDVTYNVMR